jgi:hypothetical protein
MASEREIDLDQQRSVREILGATVRLYYRYPLLFAILAVAVVAPYDLVVLGITGYGPLRSSHENTGISLLLLLLRSSLITPLISALYVHAIVAIGEGLRPRLRAVALQGLRVLPVVAAAEIMASLGIALGLVAFVIPGIVLSLRWAVVAQAAALEGEGWLDALRSSRRLTATHYEHVFGLLFLTGILAFVVLLGVRAIPLGSTSGAASVTVGIVVETAIASFAAVTLALLYFGLRAWPEATRRAEPIV